MPRASGATWVGMVALLWIHGAAAPRVTACATAETAETAETSEPADVAADDDPGESTIVAIEIHAGNIFDPDQAGENRKVYRLVNRLHRTTRPRVVRRILLVDVGRPFVQREVDESARLLREARYLYDADIKNTRDPDGNAHLDVYTRDVWSLKGGLGFGRSGGTNSVHIGLADTNFLGLGKTLSFKHSTNVDRTESLYRVVDPNFLGSRVVAELDYSSNSDGSLKLVSVERPFYSLDTRRAAGGSAWSEERVDPIYDGGMVIRSFGHLEERAEGWIGFSRGLRNKRVQRWSVGFTAEQDRFAEIPDQPPGSSIPGDRTLHYPWIEFESIADEYFVARDMDKIERREDRNLGRHYSVRLGLISTALGSDRNQVLLDAGFGAGFRPGPDQYLFLDSHASGRFSSDPTENGLLGGAVGYYLRGAAWTLLFAGLRADVARNLDAEDQLLLGGDSGLRGYPLRFQDGDRRVLLTLEQRFYSDWHVLKLLRVGAAVFVDVGRSWSDPQPGMVANPWLRDIGVGLRVGSSRTADAAMLHFDLAFPLDGGDSISRVQFLIKSRNSF